MFSRLSQAQQVFVGTSASLGFCIVTFYSFRSKKAGHNVFDVDKPEAVQDAIDQREKEKVKALREGK
jgi:hypothetical protein